MRCMAHPQRATVFPYTNWMGTERVRTDETGSVMQYCAWSDFGSTPTCTTYTDPVGPARTVWEHVLLLKSVV